jgi:hypothetical protein
MAKSAQRATSDAPIRASVAWQTPPRRSKEPFEKRGGVCKLAAKCLQSRLAMGMAAIILTFAMPGHHAGVAVQHVRPDDLNPMMIWNGAEGKVIRVKNRTLEYYENIRIVYQIERRLKNCKNGRMLPSDNGKPCYAPACVGHDIRARANVTPSLPKKQLRSPARCCPNWSAGRRRHL